MLFSSPEFIFVFLPLTFAGCWLVSRLDRTAGAIWLVAASLVFYAYWNVAYLGLLIPSIILNYLAGRLIASLSGTARWAAAAVAISANLAVLVGFKYAAFIATGLNGLGANLAVPVVALPLGISFITFQKIAFIADTYRAKVRPKGPLAFALFVSFFPQLIAGPIVHYNEMQPQFERTPWATPSGAGLIKAATLISIGLFKKIVLADNLSPFADQIFRAGQQHDMLPFADALTGTISFGLQIYFDFSGYSDMAIGLAALFGIELPLNFASPYKARSIVDFWRTWHITLSRFLRDYLYIPLGGNRSGYVRRYANLIVTMVLGGLWHGAAWSFALWGLLHGLYLCINYGWRYLCDRSRLSARIDRLPGMGSAYWALTLCSVMLAWCVFRAPDVATAARVATAIMVPVWGSPHVSVAQSVLLAAATIWVLTLPNSQQIAAYVDANSRLRLVSGVACGLAFTTSLYFMSINQYENFIYFRF
jgi:D-alanyl-lipoteichoic acid acyltransferase DltB (MBOAT superfamily)